MGRECGPMLNGSSSTDERTRPFPPRGNLESSKTHSSMSVGRVGVEAVDLDGSWTGEASQTGDM